MPARSESIQNQKKACVTRRNRNIVKTSVRLKIDIWPQCRAHSVNIWLFSEHNTVVENAANILKICHWIYTWRHHDSSCSSIQSLCAFKTKTNKNHCKTQKKETGRFQGGLAYVYIYICIYIYDICICVYIYIYVTAKENFTTIVQVYVFRAMPGWLSLVDGSPGFFMAPLIVTVLWNVYGPQQTSSGKHVVGAS